MCFSAEMSGGFALLGLVVTFAVYLRTRNFQLAIGAFYFFLMEALQYFQYQVIDDGCDDWWNQKLTILGLLHICFQPYFTHLLACGMTLKAKDLHQYMIILRLCLIGGCILFARFLLADPTKDMDVSQGSKCGISTEWLRGEKLCTFRGNHHLAWSVPLADVSYYVPSAQLHSFMMFVPFLVTKPSMMVLGSFLFATGPIFAAYMTDNLMEQASIWCLFSICQIISMAIMFVLFDSNFKTSKSYGKTIDGTVTEASLSFFLMWPTDVTEKKHVSRPKGKNA